MPLDLQVLGLRGGDRSAEPQTGAAGIEDHADASVFRHCVDEAALTAKPTRVRHRAVAILDRDEGEPYRPHIPFRVDLIEAAFLRRRPFDWAQGRPFEHAIEPNRFERRLTHRPAEQPAVEFAPYRGV